MAHEQINRKIVNGEQMSDDRVGVGRDLKDGGGSGGVEGAWGWLPTLRHGP